VLEDRRAVDPIGELNKRDMMHFLTRSLTHKERFIIEQYYQVGHTMREIGEMLALTESRVCQIHSNVMSAPEGPARAEVGHAAHVSVRVRGEIRRGVPQRAPRALSGSAAAATASPSGRSRAPRSLPHGREKNTRGAPIGTPRVIPSDPACARGRCDQGCQTAW
jgi:hypothetical protein